MLEVKKQVRKFWIFMLVIFFIVLGFAVACAASDNFKIWFSGTVLGVSGQIGQTIAGWWTSISATPLYQQWHMLIWFAGGVIGTVIVIKAWSRRPHILPKTKAATSTSEYQDQLSTPEPFIQSSKTQVTPKPETPKTEKEIEAET